jgi:hypothetical protein
MSLCIQLQYVAEEMREALQQVSPEDHAIVMDAYFKMCQRAGIGDKTAVQTLTPSITDEEYYDVTSDIDKYLTR